MTGNILVVLKKALCNIPREHAQRLPYLREEFSLAAVGRCIIL